MIEHKTILSVLTKVLEIFDEIWYNKKKSEKVGTNERIY